MKITASAPGKTILFGEHAVVYGKPALAIAVNKKARVNIEERSDFLIKADVPALDVSGYLEPLKGIIKYENRSTKPGILNYILKALQKIQMEIGTNFSPMGMDIKIDLEMPIGAGLGSSAAVTVATIAATSRYYEIDLEKKKIASLAHQVELEVQGAASPIDTSLSTYGGAIYLSPDVQEVVKLPLDWDIPLIIGHTRREGNTAELIKSVLIKKEKYPSIINPIFNTMGEITEQAREALDRKDEDKLGELMNINQGLLDALGVNTPQLSHMIYLARKTGALGSKITGAGGGGSIIAYCPEHADEVLLKLQQVEKAFPAQIAQKGYEVRKIR
jgi:mevalonate kinase